MVFSGWAGTFFGGAFGDWTLIGHLALLLFVAAFGEIWPDPLRLGRSGNMLLLAFVATVMVSHVVSPVARAGTMSLILLPAFVMVPSAVVRCWATAEQRKLGLKSMAVVVAIIAGWSLFSWWQLETPGTSLPLGHHNLLAAWLLVLLPVVSALWRDGGADRLLASVALVLGSTALILTESLGAAVAVAVIALWAATRNRWGRIGLIIAAALLVLQSPRLAKIVAGADFSTIARLSYLQAGWKGFMERPAVGWGPGAASWTISEHFRPLPGIHPPDQVVADLHSAPLQIAYELGIVGLLLAVGLGIVWVVRRRRVQPQDPGLWRGAFLGLTLLALVSCVGRMMAISALPLAAALVAGMVLSAEGVPRTASRRWPTVVAATLMMLLALPLDLAQLAYDDAVAASSKLAQDRYLQRAIKLDPGFPLYRIRQVLLGSSAPVGNGERADQARQAAVDARGLAALWLTAGRLGQEVEAPWARAALVRACRTSPLGALAPFYLSTGDASSRPEWAARALLAEPLLLSASRWENRQEMIAAAVELSGQVEGVDAWWRHQLEETYLWLGEFEPSSSAPRRLALTLDGDDTTSVSLHAFRRQPWPTTLAEIEVDEAWVGEIDLVAATELRSTDPAVFAQSECRLGSEQVP